MVRNVTRQNKMENRGSVVRFLATATYLSHFGFVHTGPVTHPSSHSSGSGVKMPGREPNHSFHLATRLRKTGATPPRPPYTLISCTGTTLILPYYDF